MDSLHAPSAIILNKTSNLRTSYKQPTPSWKKQKKTVDRPNKIISFEAGSLENARTHKGNNKLIKLTAVHQVHYHYQFNKIYLNGHQVQPHVIIIKILMDMANHYDYD